VIGHLADVIAARAPGESMLAAIRRDYAEAIARADVTLASRAAGAGVPAREGVSGSGRPPRSGMHRSPLLAVSP
jgi:hypothetical protein